MIPISPGRQKIPVAWEEMTETPSPETGLRVFQRAFTKASPIVKNSITKNQWLLTPSRQYATKTRFGIRPGKTGQELKEAAMEPSVEKIFKIDQMGRWFIAGGAAVGLGALCYYGLGMSNEIGAIEKAVIWPQYVKDRIHSTYMYLAGSIGLTALSALAVSRTPVLMNFMMRGSWVTIGATFAAMIGAGMMVQSIPYDQSPVPKHLAWLLHSARQNGEGTRTIGPGRRGLALSLTS
ncbi:PREDICTED: growth hormone-inducible transmembrane protein-like [Odobenus rosmarus divergens]|uniref:Growth hormone-inducible transmembrane protein-like n=1 Tax=Odobenus rosmarus divergens TaxID=9708 RepID=A0A9B0LIN7_ODORO